MKKATHHTLSLPRPLSPFEAPPAALGAGGIPVVLGEPASVLVLGAAVELGVLLLRTELLLSMVTLDASVAGEEVRVDVVKV